MLFYSYVFACEGRQITWENRASREIQVHLAFFFVFKFLLFSFSCLVLNWWPLYDRQALYHWITFTAPIVPFNNAGYFTGSTTICILLPQLVFWLWCYRRVFCGWKKCSWKMNALDSHPGCRKKERCQYSKTKHMTGEKKSLHFISVIVSFVIFYKMWKQLGRKSRLGVG